MGDKRSYADVLKEANKQLDEMTGDESVGKKKEDSQKKMKTVNVPIPDLKEGGAQIPCGVLLQLQLERSLVKPRKMPPVVLKRCVV